MKVWLDILVGFLVIFRGFFFVSFFCGGIWYFVGGLGFFCHSVGFFGGFCLFFERFFGLVFVWLVDFWFGGVFLFICFLVLIGVLLNFISIRIYPQFSC